MTNARRDSFIVLLKKRWGREGVCRWWEILEIIAEEMKNDVPEASFIPGFWVSELGFRSSIDCRSFVEWLAINGRLIVDISPNEWCLKCPKLLEIKDWRIENRYHKKKETESEEETDKEKNKRKAQPKVSPEEYFSSLNGKVEKWKLAFPGININSEIEKMKAWLEANPTRHKKNYDRFVTNWLSRTKPTEQRWPSGPFQK